MLFLLSQIAPAVVAQQLDEATLQLEKTMKGILVTNDTVKKYLERVLESGINPGLSRNRSGMSVSSIRPVPQTRPMSRF